jgi:hypothetical protein
MKFKNVKGGAYRRLDIVNNDGDILRIETKDMVHHKHSGVYIINTPCGGTEVVTDLSRATVLKLARAIIAELDPLD